MMWPQLAAALGSRHGCRRVYLLLTLPASALRSICTSLVTGRQYEAYCCGPNVSHLPGLLLRVASDPVDHTGMDGMTGMDGYLR